MPVIGAPRSGLFYPSLVWAGGRIDFDDPVTVSVPPLTAIRGKNISVSGLQETLYERTERRVDIVFRPISGAMLTSLRNYCETWGFEGGEAFLTLDRLDTCGSLNQVEYDVYNRFFTRAVLINDTFAPERMTLSRPFYQIALSWRQQGS
ncbi:MAG TPA: hypothetical protein VKA83_09400 [Methylomirabilota bacterium]|nr:hypothetical protein [Methylomirabilota bacterium]